MSRTFKAKLESQGPNGAWTLLWVPFDVEKVFGSRARVSVRGTINGFAYRSSIFPNGAGKHMMMVNKAMRQGGSAHAGETVTIVMDVDTAPRTVRTPRDLKAALSSSNATAAFQKLSYSQRKELVDWIEGAKKAETRASRIAKTLVMVRDGKRLKS